MVRTNFLNIVILIALIGTLFGGVAEAHVDLGTQSQSQLVTNSQIEAVANAEFPTGHAHGSALPFPLNGWQRHLEDVVLYPHSDTQADPQAATHSISDGFLDYQRPVEVPAYPAQDPYPGFSDPDQKRVSIVSGTSAVIGITGHTYATFTLLRPLLDQADAGAFEKTVKFYGAYAEMYAQCTGGSNTDIIVEFDRLVFDNGAWTKVDTSGSSGHQPEFSITLETSSDTASVEPALYRPDGNSFITTGDVNLDNSGWVWNEGERLQINVRPSGNSQRCTLFFDTNSVDTAPGGNIIDGSTTNPGFPSFVRLRADTGRITTWIDRDSGEIAQSLPDPSSTSADRRKFKVQVAHASLWPDYNDYVNRAWVSDTAGLTYRDVTNYQDLQFEDNVYDPRDGPVGYQSHGVLNNLHRKEVRIIDTDVAANVYDSRTGTWPSIIPVPTSACNGATSCMTALDEGINLRTYQFSYTGALPKHNFRAEVYSEGFGSSLSQVVPVGLKGMDVTIGQPAHSVAIGEPTVFRVTISNTGSTSDVFTVSASAPGGNWLATVLNPSVSVAPGGQGDVLVRVSPPATASVGTTKDVQITVASSFPNEVPAVSKILSTTIVAPRAPGASLSGAPSVIEIFPGEEISIPGIILKNTGSAVDNYIVSARAPSNIAGWTMRADPTSINIPADSSDGLRLVVKAPASAPEGQSFAITVQAQRVGSTTAAATLAIPVEVILVPALDLSIGSPAQYQQRADGFDRCGDDFLLVLCASGPTDTDFSQSAVYRVQIHNPTPVADTYNVRGTWNKGVDHNQPNTGCTQDGTNGGPDYWRVKVADAQSIAGAPVVKASKSTITNWINDIEVPGMTTKDIFVQLSWVYPSTSNCDYPDDMAGSSASDPVVSYDLIVKSLTDESVVSRVEVMSGITGVPAHLGGQKWGNAVHAVAIEPGRIEGPTKTVAPDGIAVRNGANYDAARYPIVIRNEANEKDTLLVTVPAATKAGWTQTLEWVANADGGANTSPVTCTGSGRQWQCPGLGAGDEATFNVVVTPSGSVSERSTLQTTVTVKSLDDGTKIDDLTFTTRATGALAFEATRLATARSGAVGTDIALPFVINNVGTEGDNYRLSVTLGDASWKPRFSGSTQVFVPGQNDHAGFLMVTVPQGATGSKVFRVQVESLGGAGIALLDFEARVGASQGISLKGTPGNEFVLPSRGVPHQIEAIATSATASTAAVTFSVETSTVPSGWTVRKVSDGAFAEVAGSNPVRYEATGKFEVTAPAGALSTSRVPVQIKATTADSPARVAERALIVSLQSDVGLHMEPISPTTDTIIASGQVTYSFDVINDALDQDTVTLSNTDLPEGWTITYAPKILTLGPLEAQTVDVVLSAGLDATAGTEVAFTMFATSGRDASVFDTLGLSAVVGFNSLTSSAPNGTKDIGPEEAATFVVTVTNRGTVRDEVAATATIATDLLAEFATVTVSPAQFQLAVNASKDVQVTVTTKRGIPSDVDVTARLRLESLLNTQTTAVTREQDVTAHILKHVAIDVDGDSIKEYAIDRNKNAADGFEDFRDSQTTGGKTSRAAALESFLSADARKSFMVQVAGANNTTVEVFNFKIDGDNDGFTDIFVDDNGDGRPNIYFDPDHGRFHRITVFKDVNGDAVLDYFVDVDGDKVLDKVYNVVTGKFTGLLVRDIDGDGTLDYAVDTNGNGQIDPNETVLFTRGGVLVTVLKVDVDGDGKLDDVFDTDGDGRVDHFIRNGETTARKITLMDVNGDGILDWTYDSNLDGRPDGFYDPVTQKGGQKIDTAANFQDLAADYWYVPTLFLLVAILFIVLVAVTRR